ncbi:MAG: ISL3 family transposase [Flavobacteriales bacterium]
MRLLITFLRNVLNLQAVVIEGGRFEAALGQAVICVRRRRNAKPRCPQHGCVLTGKIVEKTTRWRSLNFAKCRLQLEANLREGRCPRCDGRRDEAVPWASHRAKHTTIFDRWVARLVQLTDKTAVAELAGIAWRTVGAIIERVIAEIGPKNLLDDLVGITVVEVSHKRGHRYLTIVTNLENGLAVWAGEGKGAATLLKFFDELGLERTAKLQVVAMDMSGGYRSAVLERAKNAEIIYDRFHIVKLLLEAVDGVRRDECRSLEGEDRKELKHTRFALLRNPKHLKPKDKLAIARVQATNKHLTRAYELRVDFEEFWKIKDEEKGRKFLMSWTRSALLSRLAPLQKFAKTIRGHMEGVLGFIRWYGITSGQAEGMNNKIKLLIHRAFGFHSAAAVMAMITLCCSGIRP